MSNNSIKNVTVIGAGVLGSQIAYQASFHGFKVISYDINEEALATAKQRFEKLAKNYRRDLNADDIAINQATENLTQSCDLVEAVKNADVIIEAVSENLTLKQELWQKIGQSAPKHTIFCTNTSTLLPSSFADSSGDPSRFLALHFANNIWVQNIVEVMGTTKTNPDIVQATETFAKDMGMNPIVIQKEVAGYVMNRLLVPLLTSASHLLADDVANPKDIDKVWRLATRAPAGPFEIMDVVGLRTVYAIHSAKGKAHNDELTLKFADILKNEYLDKGRFGREVGKGFYDYDEDGQPIR